MAIIVRPAQTQDGEALAELDRETWSPLVTPGTYRPHPFFETTRPEDVLVASIEGRIVGYVQARPPTALPSNAHVLTVGGLAVSSAARGQGVAGRLLTAVQQRAADRGVERVTLRVLSVNAPARALYEKLGYVIEGVLVGEFRLPVGADGAVVAVDDVLMARSVAP